MRFLLALAAVWRLFGRVPRPRFRGEQRHPWPLPGRSVIVGEREFIVREAGEPDGTPIVLVHGLGGSSLAEWYEVGPALAESRRVILVDHRNHGMAPRTTEPYEIDDLADDLGAVLDRVVDGPVDVVGYSMGGAIAEAFAHRRPDLVRRLVLVATFAFHPRGWRIARQIGVYVIRAWERVFGFGTPQVRAGYLILTGAVAPEYARWMWDETHRRDVDGGAEASLALFRFDARPWIGTLACPTLVVVPARDQLVPPRWQYRLGEMIPGAKVVDVAGARHELPWTHPARLVVELTAFTDPAG